MGRRKTIILAGISLVALLTAAWAYFAYVLPEPSWKTELEKLQEQRAAAGKNIYQEPGVTGSNQLFTRDDVHVYYLKESSK